LIRIGNPKDFWAGIVFVALGAAAIGVALDYRFGTAGRMGPGYFPCVLGGILVVLGGVTALKGVGEKGAPIEALPWKTLLLVLGSVALFALILSRVGLVIAAFVLITLSGMAAPGGSAARLVAYAIVLTLAVAVTFVCGLGLAIPLWPWSG
jgi:hypothetical protein